jgi:hypothetical protein
VEGQNQQTRQVKHQIHYHPERHDTTRLNKALHERPSPLLLARRKEVGATVRRPHNSIYHQDSDNNLQGRLQNERNGDRDKWKLISM